jgi:hypothetical protein
MVVAADKDTADNRVAEEAAVTRAAEESAEKAAADKEAADNITADEAAVKGVAVEAGGNSPAPGQAPSLVAGTKRVAAPPRRPNDPTGAFLNLGLSTPAPFQQGFILCKSPFHTVPLPPARPPRRALLLLPQAPLPPRRLSGQLQGRLPATGLKPRGGP